MDITVSGYRSILNQVIVVKDLVVNKNILVNLEILTV